MMIDPTIAYRALKSRDPRFDGVFFVGVTSTGVYCRPICPARTPLRKNCLFFEHVGAAEKARFRPCLRCRPELAPGNAPVDQARRITLQLLHRIDEGLLEDGVGLEEIAGSFQLSSRQLRRIIGAELGVSLIQLIQTRRLLLAKQLLTDTRLPVTEIAYASGFASLRRFNAAFSARYRMPPTRLRRETKDAAISVTNTTTSELRLGYRPPYDWSAMLDFLEGRRIKQVEWIADGNYFRTVQLGKHAGWIRVANVPSKSMLTVEFTHTLMPVLPALLGRLRHLFDLSARPDMIGAHLGKDKLLSKSLLRFPGLRVPGAFDGFELAIRAILGQQITVKAATTISCRLAEAYGEPIETPFPELSQLAPTAARIARCSVDDIARLGIIAARSATILAVARSFEDGTLDLETGAPPERTIESLVGLPGIGPWTAHYIAMRALRWTDAFPKEDIALRNCLGGLSARQAEERSQTWRPWRSYAVMHLWKLLSEGR